MENSEFIKKSKASQERVTVREWLAVSFWVVKLVYSVSPAYAIGYFVVSIIGGLRSIINVYILAVVLDKIITIAGGAQVTFTEIRPLLILLVVVEVVMIIIGGITSYFRSTFGMVITPYLRQKLYTKINELDVQTIENPDINNRLNRAAQNIGNVTAYYRQTMGIVSQLSAAISTFGILSSFLPSIIPLMILTLIPKFLGDKKFRKEMWSFSIDTTDAQRKSGRTASDLESPSELPEIFINGCFSFFDKKYMKFRLWQNDFVKTQTRKWMSFSYGTDILTLIPVYLGFVKVLMQLVTKKITTGTIYFQLEMLRQFKDRTEGVFLYYNEMFEHSLKLKEVFALFETEPSYPDGKVKMPKLEKGPKILIDNLTFKYPQSKNPVIHNMDLSIKSGEKVAIVGHNGAGKTTLVKLICRLYKATEGKILINDVNIDDLQSKSYYQNIGLLFQEFNTHGQFTVKENITIGDTSIKADMKKVKEAAANADALDFIEKFPDKWNQVLSQTYEGGIRPSTGQWQKIAIARFFYRNAPLVIFDEPTAAIDAISEYNIFNKIYEFFRNKTVIIISHRFSTVRNADRIIVMKDGKIIEDGTHKELMNKKGYYAESFTLQAEGYNRD